MAYVPPHKRAGYTAEQRPNPFGNDRRQEEREERERRRQEAEERGREIARRKEEEERKHRLPDVTEENFPALGGGGKVLKKTNAVGGVSFAEQAARWKEQRERDDYEQKVKAEYERMLEERRAHEKFAMDIALSRMPGAPPKTHTPAPRKTIVREAPIGAQQDEWVTYEDPKKRKQREALAVRDQKRMEALLRDPSPEDAEEGGNEGEDMWGGEEHEEWH
jgi:hypothetical protein